jgi:hypothetical protein
MKNFARCLVMLFLMGVSSNIYAQEWVAYNQYVQPQPQIQTVYVQPQPVIIYQWVPYAVQQNVIVEQRRLFCVNQTLVSRPTVQWILQPIVIYK